MKKDFTNVIAIIKKEFKTYFDSPTAYIILIVFLMLWEFLFFKDVFLVGEASLRGLFSFLPWLFLLLIPAITMGIVSQEKNEGTLEFLLTHPLKIGQLIAGKFLAALFFIVMALGLSLPVAFMISGVGTLDWGVVFGQYFGSILMGAVFVSMGIFVSSLFKSQISSLLLSAAAGFLLIISGFGMVTDRLPNFIAKISERLSVLSHFESISRGVIDFRDIWYFSSAIIIFLALTFLVFIGQRFGNQKKVYARYQLGIALVIGIAVLSNIVGARMPGRIDLTSNDAFTLSPATKEIVGSLDDIVNIRLFASNQLPAQLQPTLRDTKDLLRDYQMLGKGNVILKIEDPKKDEKVAEDAKSFGVEEVQFNVIGGEEFEMKKGYLGIAISSKGKSESIPFVNSTSDLEYQLTSLISMLTQDEKKKIVFITGHGEKSTYSELTAFKKELSRQYVVEEIEMASVEAEEGKEKPEPVSIPEDADVIVVAGPKEEFDESAIANLQSFLDKGKSAFFMIDRMQIDMQTLSASESKNNLVEFLNENYGVTVEKDIVFDQQSNQIVPYGQSQIPIHYPYLTKTVARSDQSVIVANLETVLMPWASSVSINEKKIGEKGFNSSANLLTTTNAGGRKTSAFNLMPEEFEKASLSELGVYTLATSLTGDNGTRLVVVGDSDFLTDQFIQNNFENLAFGLESTSWLAQEDSLSAIKLKSDTINPMTFEGMEIDREQAVSRIKVNSYVIALGLPIAIGAFRFYRRRKLRNKSFSTN